jgi:regulator of RNase E activity RraA
VEVFGQTIQPGQLIHADKHGFLAIPKEDEEQLLNASRLMDQFECQTVIPAGRYTQGLPAETVVERLREAGKEFQRLAKEAFQRQGEWS